MVPNLFDFCEYINHCWLLAISILPAKYSKIASVHTVDGWSRLRRQTSRKWLFAQPSTSTTRAPNARCSCRPQKRPRSNSAPQAAAHLNILLKGHSCNIGNAPSLVGKKLKTVICVFWMYIWYGITLTKMGKEMGKLKKNFNTYIWQNVWFFRPEEILTISCKIRCQSFNFICQALEQSLKFANRSYRLKEYICFQVFLKITFFLANM